MPNALCLLYNLPPVYRSNHFHQYPQNDVHFCVSKYHRTQPSSFNATNLLWPFLLQVLATNGFSRRYIYIYIYIYICIYLYIYMYVCISHEICSWFLALCINRFQRAHATYLTHCGLVTPLGDIDMDQHGSGNGLMHDGTTPWHEPMLTVH